MMAAVSAYTHELIAMNDCRQLPRLLRAAYFAMHRVSDAHFSRHGVTADQFVLLACLAEEDAITQRELARRASSDPSTIRAMLVLLEGRGLISRERRPDDSRARVVTLTAKGQRMFERLRKSSEPIRSQMLGGFSAEEARLFVHYFDRLIDNLAIKTARGGRKPSKVASPTGGTR
jgi:DNA-binding MarR family transcriptional regulator